MRPIRTLLLILSCAFAVSAQGQKAPPPAAPTYPPPAASTISESLDQQLTQIEKNVVGLAEAMPADKYDFTPESLAIPGSNFKGVRDFARQVIHIAGANYLYWSGVVGEPIPAGIMSPNLPESLRNKDACIKLLKDSFALGHRVIATLTPQNLMDTFPVRQTKQTRLFLAVSPLAHTYDIYGQMVEYLRMNGKIPPASAPGDF